VFTFLSKETKGKEQRDPEGGKKTLFFYSFPFLLLEPNGKKYLTYS